MESLASPTRTRLCSLCQQYYGSGVRDHVAASDILRSRRMLLFRSAGDDPRVREGLDQFLDDLSQHGTSAETQKPSHHLGVCVLCTQFLPSMYQEDKLVDDLRHQLLASGTTHNHSSSPTRRKTSNLVIQHQLPKAPPLSSAQNVLRRPSQPHTYRLLTDEITRVLQLDASTIRSSLADQSSLMAGNAIKDLRYQERRQSCTILAARRAAQDAKLDAAQQNRHVRSDDAALSSEIHEPRTEKCNFVRAMATEASSLYTGVVVHPPSSSRRIDHFAAASAAHAKVVRSKHGRHVKTELKFPSLLPERSATVVAPNRRLKRFRKTTESKSMQRDECIYNLIPRVVVAPVKPERYKSKHDPKVAPTASTFGLQGQTRLVGANVGEDTHIERKASAKGIGRISDKPDPMSFIKKGDRCSTTVDPSKKPSKFDYAGAKKPGVVTREEKPIMGLKSSKNYVTANAVEAILAVPGNRARVTKEPPQYLKKDDFGQVPKYLNQVKDEIERENEMIEEFVRQNRNMLEEDDGARVEPVDERERLELVNALKAKWDHVNTKYQKLCHNVVFDTLGKVRRKETFEKELAQLEKDIELLSKGHVAVAKTNDYRY